MIALIYRGEHTFPPERFDLPEGGTFFGSLIGAYTIVRTSEANAAQLLKMGRWERVALPTSSGPDATSQDQGQGQGQGGARLLATQQISSSAGGGGCGCK